MSDVVSFAQEIMAESHFACVILVTILSFFSWFGFIPLLCAIEHHLIAFFPLATLCAYLLRKIIVRLSATQRRIEIKTLLLLLILAGDFTIVWITDQWLYLNLKIAEMIVASLVSFITGLTVSTLGKSQQNCRINVWVLAIIILFFAIVFSIP